MENDVTDLITTLDGGWGEATCCRCKDCFVVEEGDELPVALSEEGKPLGILCGRCDRIMAEKGVPERA